MAGVVSRAQSVASSASDRDSDEAELADESGLYPYRVDEGAGAYDDSFAGGDVRNHVSLTSAEPPNPPGPFWKRYFDQAQGILWWHYEGPAGMFYHCEGVTRPYKKDAAAEPATPQPQPQLQLGTLMDAHPSSSRGIPSDAADVPGKELQADVVETDAVDTFRDDVRFKDLIWQMVHLRLSHEALEDKMFDLLINQKDLKEQVKELQRQLRQQQS
jgi:hypothetical protein